MDMFSFKIKQHLALGIHLFIALLQRIKTESGRMFVFSYVFINFGIDLIRTDLTICIFFFQAMIHSVKL